MKNFNQKNGRIRQARRIQGFIPVELVYGGRCLRLLGATPDHVELTLSDEDAAKGETIVFTGMDKESWKVV